MYGKIKENNDGTKFLVIETELDDDFIIDSERNYFHTEGDLLFIGVMEDNIILGYN